MIIEKTLLETKLKLDTTEEMLYRFNKKQNKWTSVDPSLIYCIRYNEYIFGQIRIDNKHFLLHRIIYYMYNDNFDIFDNSKNNTIDHINREPCDNSIENLRVATLQEQQQNKKNYRGVPVKGYSRTKNGRFKGTYTDSNKQRFSKTFDTTKEAHTFYLNNKISF